MRRWLTGVAVLAAGATLGFGGVAGATGPRPGHSPGDDTTTTTAVPADAVVAATSTVTLPLFGAPLTLDVSTDPSGQLASVSINPADGYTAVVDRPNKVSFVNEDGTAKVRVTAGKRGQSASAKGTTLADVSGPGGWSGDVFGNGTTTTVSFTVGAAADGGPDITGVTSSDPSATIGDTGHFGGRSTEVARASVSFAAAGQKRTLWITVMVSERDEKSRASVSVSLSNVRGVAQDAADAAGTKTWSGMLCDGTAASITYTVGTDGSISDVTATPAGATIDDTGRGVKVGFATGERFTVSAREKDGQIKVDVGSKFRCDVTDPSVNTPTSTIDDDHRGDDHRGDGKDNGGWGGERDGKGGRDDGGGRDGNGSGGSRDGSSGSGGHG